MVKQTRDEKTLAVFSRQWGHLPDPGWRPAQATPIEAWNGLLLEDDPTPCSRFCSELLYMCGTFFSCGPLKPLCNTLASCRRFTCSSLKCLFICLCGCIIPMRLKRPQRKVVAMIIPEQGLTGSLPKQPGWGLLKLNRMILYGNAIHGPLRGISKFRFLEVLNLSSNRLTGIIPPSLGYLRALRILDLHGNAFTGNLDEQANKAKLHYLRRLSYVSLDDNMFEGTFPSCFIRMSWLIELHLSGMKLTGTIPDCHTLTKLRVLDLSFNAFTGKVPDLGRQPSAPPMIKLREIMKKKKEEALKKKNNESKKDGDVESPRRIRGFSTQKGLKARRSVVAQQLKDRERRESRVVVAAESDQTIEVDLHNQSRLSISTQHQPTKVDTPSTAIEEKQIKEEKERNGVKEENSVKLESTDMLEGMPTPCEKLQVLKLTRNQLTGELPVSFGKLTNLKKLEIGSNKLVSLGGDRMSWSKLTRLEVVDFSRNKIEGNIPIQLASMEQLKVLRLESNQLTGKIPDVLSRLQQLELVDLTRNPALELRKESNDWLKSVLKSSTTINVL